MHKLIEAAILAQDHEKLNELLKNVKKDELEKKNGSGLTVLHVASLQPENGIIVQKLIKAGASTETRDTVSRFTALHYAAKEGFVDLVKILIDEGADINATNKISQTALHFACFQNDENTARYLLSKGADPTIMDWKRNRPHDLAKDWKCAMVTI